MAILALAAVRPLAARGDRGGSAPLYTFGIGCTWPRRAPVARGEPEALGRREARRVVVLSLFNRASLGREAAGVGSLI